MLTESNLEVASVKLLHKITAFLRPYGPRKTVLSRKLEPSVLTDLKRLFAFFRACLIYYAPNGGHYGGPDNPHVCERIATAWGRMRGAPRAQAWLQ